MTDSMGDWHQQAHVVAASCRSFLPDLIGVYVHGSAALGGMNPASDLDILVVTETETGAAQLGPSLLARAGTPHALELSVVTHAAAKNPHSPWPFVLHVNSADNRSLTDPGEGDPDLIAHYAVTRAAGIALVGPDPDHVIGMTDREQLIRYLRGELQWGIDHGDQRYAVLNACRASAYASTGKLLSKIDGATWWTRTHGPSELVARAHEAQTAGVNLGPATPDARNFVMDRIAELRRQEQSIGSRH